MFGLILRPCISSYNHIQRFSYPWKVLHLKAFNTMMVQIFKIEDKSSKDIMSELIFMNMYLSDVFYGQPCNRTK